MRSLTMLLPTQVVDRWALISRAMLECGMYDELVDVQEQRNNMLQITLAGGMHVWVGYEDDKFVGFVISTISVNQLTGIKNFVVLGVWTDSGFTDEMFKVCLHTLTTYAKSRECVRLVTYTAIRPLIERLKGLGGKLENVQITFDL